LADDDHVRWSGQVGRRLHVAHASHHSVARPRQRGT
jgi:hypothetical protein